MFIDSVKEPRIAVVASLLLWNSFTEFETGQLDTFGLQHRCKDQYTVDDAILFVTELLSPQLGKSSNGFLKNWPSNHINLGKNDSTSISESRTTSECPASALVQ